MAQDDIFRVMKCDLPQDLPWFFGCGIFNHLMQLKEF